MYNYTIYEEKNHEEVELEFICNKKDETISELRKIADEKLAELQRDHPNPSAIKMKRKITPLL